MLKVRYLTGIVPALLSISLISSPVLAIDKPANLPERGNEIQTNRIDTTGSVKSCQARESAIVQRMDQLVKLVTNMENVFDKIATRVESYYNNTVVPSGKSVPNYTTLVNDIQINRNLVQTSLDKTRSDFSSFGCTSENARNLLIQFRTDMQNVKDALKNFRTSVNKLIVAVHTVSSKIPTTPPTAEPTEEKR